jgi:hypothetical protein
MAAQFGRTVDRWFQLMIDDSSGTLRQIPVLKVAGLGIDYPVVRIGATQDPGDGGLPTTPTFKMTITCPLDTTASTGAFTVLSGVNGGSTPLSLNIQLGMQHAWVPGEPTFGITSSATAGVLVTKLEVQPDAGTCTADIYLWAGSTSMVAWSTTAYT